ncbi:glycosyltransferase family 2 protein [Caminibacter mediatlanticus TB-2]|uniref:Glycosyltransferase family 2 protein n=1 Tax=Caminibacter mediatlanticus TB-2 TaxID=391592 RepID=A0ABX5VAR4_9BACT|nr:glycosyltransferase family 2 protein [Caminibacter mediatlanticus]QCT93939.1 glycosyltransferase family 2 protein [Caminibacter mediatlanticus TB-2]
MFTRDKLISVVMATYNGEKFLREQLDSILNQTYKNLEIIICDDCSTDKTWKILEEYKQKDQRIKIFKNETNIGYVKNFEKAISLCKGDFIALSDQDDIWIENKIEILLKNIKNYDLIHSDAYLIDETGTVIHNSYSSLSKKYLYPKDIVELAFTPSVTGCTCMFTKSLKNKAIPFCKNIHVHDLWISLVAFKNNGIIYYDTPLIKYRQHANNQIGALKQKTSLFDKIKKVKNIYNIKISLNKFLSNNLNRLKCIEKYFILTQEEKSYLENVKCMYNYLSMKNVRFFYYFFKVKNKIWKDLIFYNKLKNVILIYIKLILLDFKGKN